MYTIDCKALSNNIFLFVTEKQWQICDAFLRPQEFYESDFDEIRGSVFTLEEYVKYSLVKLGKFDYFSAWAGFNIPGATIKKFIAAYEGHTLREGEAVLIHHLIANGISPINDDNYYIIGANKEDHEELDSIIDHELCHAFWYLNESYKQECMEILSESCQKLITDIKKKLKSMGYADHVLEDEINAYLATGDDELLMDNLGKRVFKKIPMSLREDLNKKFTETKTLMNVVTIPK